MMTDIEANSQEISAQQQPEESPAPEKAPMDVKPHESSSSKSGGGSGFWWKLIAFLALELATAAIVVGSLALVRANDNDNNDNNTDSNDQPPVNLPEEMSPPQDPPMLEGSTTLYKIVNRGYLQCGITIVPGFGEVQENADGSMTYSGMDVDFCRSIAAAIFGETENPDSNIEYTTLTATARFDALASKQVDVLARVTTLTMDRDVWIPSAETGFSFSVPYIYDGHRFAGQAFFTECADNLNVTGSCAALRVCVNDGTTTLEQLQGLLPAENIVIQPSNEATAAALLNGDCAVIYAGGSAIAALSAFADSFPGGYAVGENLFSLEPLALVTREDDPRFTDFVNWILQALLSAEEQGVTQETYARAPQTDLFGETFQNLIVYSIQAVGNYGEIYQRSVEPLIPRAGLNEINSGDSGLILSNPFGSLDVERPNPTNGTIDAIKRRGHVSCGITRRAAFGEFDRATMEWSGLDVDYCAALSAALFDGVADHVVYHVLPATDRFEVLASGVVDVLARITTHNFERDVLEPTTEMGFSFSQPYFYDGLTYGGIPPYGNCANNLDVTSPECQGLRICVNDGTTKNQDVRRYFPEENIVSMPSGQESLAGLASGACNAVAGGSYDVSPASVESAGYTGPYEVGQNRYSNDPLAIVTRQDDALWSDFVYWTVASTFYAEENGISQANASAMPTTNLFGPLYRDMFRNAIFAVGNYGEIYANNVEEIVPRAGLNTLNNDNGPQFYPLPGITFAE